MFECWDVSSIPGVVYKKMNASQSEIKYNIRCAPCTIDCTWNLEEM